MKIRQSWRRVAWIVVAFAIFISGRLWRPVALLARPAAAIDSASGHSRPSSTGAQTGQSVQETAAKKVVTAGDAYMNVQILKDIPSDQLLPSMRYITTALGVECNFCHDPKSFDSDDKPEKATARKMMTMMFAINKDNFSGRREITCYTCHHGASHAANSPSLVAATTGVAANEPALPGASQPAQPSNGAAAAGTATSGTPSAMPTVDDIIAKYTDALGGAAAIQKITSFEKKGTLDMPSRKLKASAEMLRKAPNKEAWIVHLPDGTAYEEAYNGASGWQQQPGKGVDDLGGDDLVRLKEAASFIPGLNLRQEFSRVQVVGTEKIGDRDAYRIAAFRAGGGQVRFYFDTQSGLLLRVSQRIESPLGSLPQNTDYSDYRDVNGVKVPFTVADVQAEGPATFRWEQIQANVPIEDSKFDKPAAKSGQ
jgi:photosynthetic reaction center cytochrome c subunit